MAFKNPSLNSSIITEDEKNDIFNRLSKVEQNVNSLQQKSNSNIEKQDNTIFMETVDTNKEEYQIIDKNILHATLNGNPRGLSIPFIEKKEDILPIPDFSKSISLEKPNDVKPKEEYTILDISKYINKVYMSNSPQRRGLLNEQQN